MKKKKCDDSAHGLLLGYFFVGLRARERKEVERHRLNCKEFNNRFERLEKEKKKWLKTQEVGKLTGRLALAAVIKHGVDL